MEDTLELRKNKKARTRRDRDLYRIQPSRAARILATSTLFRADYMIQTKTGYSFTTESSRWLKMQPFSSRQKPTLIQSFMTASTDVLYETHSRLRLQYTNLNNFWVDVEFWTWNALRDVSIANAQMTDATNGLDAAFRAHWALAGGNQANIWADSDFDPCNVPGIINTLRLKYHGRGRIRPGETKRLFNKNIKRRYPRQDCLQYYTNLGLTTPHILSAGEWGYIVHFIPPIVSGNTQSGNAPTMTIIEEQLFNEIEFISGMNGTPSIAPAPDNAAASGAPITVYGRDGAVSATAANGNATI